MTGLLFPPNATFAFQISRICNMPQKHRVIPKIQVHIQEHPLICYTPLFSGNICVSFIPSRNKSQTLRIWKYTHTSPGTTLQECLAKHTQSQRPPKSAVQQGQSRPASRPAARPNTRVRNSQRTRDSHARSPESRIYAPPVPQKSRGTRTSVYSAITAAAGYSTR